MENEADYKKQVIFMIEIMKIKFLTENNSIICKFIPSVIDLN
jgi:hypothetical protein